MCKHGNKQSVLQAFMVFGALLVLSILAKHYEFPDIQVTHVEEVIIPGMEGEYEFLYLADLHLAIKTRADAGVYGDAEARIQAFSNAKGTASAEHLPQWIAYANQNAFDAVLMGGDIIDYYSQANAEYLFDNIEQLEMPHLFTLGNHELFSPWNEAIPEEALIYDLFQKKESAFQMLEYEEFIICAIDNNEYQVNPASYEAMKSLIENHPDKPMILLAHVPFYTENDKTLLEMSVSVWGQALVIGTGEGTRDTTSISRDFLDLVLNEDSPVVAIFTGDNHFYHKGKLTDSVTQWVADPAYAGNGTIIKVRGN